MEGEVNERIDSQVKLAELGHNKIHAIYASDSETVINPANTLVIKALCKDHDDSRLALSQFVDLPTPRRAAGPEVDRVLISQVRLLINGANAN
jgi:hypothetical protein